MERIGDWMQTISGTRVYPMDLRPEDFNIFDIAHGLSMMCRFNGHITQFYSVAEHSVHASRALPDDLALIGLLHDASEAYLSDVIRPVKPYLNNYGQIEDRFMQAIGARFGFAWPMPEEVKRIDNAMLTTEALALKGHDVSDWFLPEPALPVRLECWSPDRARVEFLQRYAELAARTGRGGVV